MMKKRVKIARFTVDELESQKPDQIITACSMCKRSLAQFSGVKVRDIAEVVASQMIVSKKALGKAVNYQRTMA
jgi:Fe-S oxidoreductase